MGAVMPGNGLADWWHADWKGPVLTTQTPLVEEPTPLTKKAKVAIFLPNLVNGGAERVLTYLANGLAHLGHRVDMVLIKAEGAYLADLCRDVRVVELASGRAILSIVALARYLRRERPDVLFSGLEHVNMVAILARQLARVPTRTIPTIHVPHAYRAQHNPTWHESLISAALKWVYPWAATIVAVSHGAAAELVETFGLTPQQVRVLYNPVLTAEMSALAGRPVSHPWFAPGQVPVIMGVGRLTSQKDFGTLIKAFARLRAEIPARLVILGEGEERPQLEQLVRELKLTEDVFLPGFEKDVFAYLARSSLFVLSSQYEALPTVLIEAMALGVPVVATNCQCGPAEILCQGEHGRLVPVGDVAALAHAMRETLSEPHHKIPEHVLRPFYIDTAAQEYAKLIAEMCDK
jgi:glycosyltransferase involved in cell wall biosynthesis